MSSIETVLWTFLLIAALVSLDPVTSVVPTQDSQTLLVASLDNHIRLMDASTGKMLNDFTGHVNESYRCRACFGHGEATVICGDEKGQVWAWDLLDVRGSVSKTRPLADQFPQGKVVATKPPTESASQSDYLDRTSPYRF